MRLGVLAPLTDPDGIAVLEGVSIALDEANARGGYHGLPYAVVARTTEGPWGITSRQGAALAYDDNVWAIIGGLDGQQAHLAELIAAKAWIPVTTPWASDLTIDYANVPWVFRTAPDDGSQARLLWRYALGRGLSRIVVAVEGTREGFVAQQRLLDAARASHHPPALVLQYGATAPEGQVPRIMNGDPEALVVLGTPGRRPEADSCPSPVRLRRAGTPPGSVCHAGSVDPGGGAGGTRRRRAVRPERHGRRA